ncbi:MAG: restriction endonuclease subunit S [Myxococcales bacterium]|nr:restriction endonuclease subunit S [Myxococcales bacterium]
MARSYPLRALGDFFRIKHGFAFKGEHFVDAGEFVLLTPGNFEARGGLKLKGDKEKYYDGEVPKDFVLRRGDLIVAMTDLTQNAPILGAPAFVTENERFLHNQRLGKVVELNEAALEKRYLYYLFNLRATREQLKATATGATVRHTAPERIYRVTAPVPGIEVQRRIADILSAYDDLIENNTKRIKILEEMARSLYREWFVNFRFPGHEKVKMVNSALGKVPEGWNASTLGTNARILMGQAPKSDSYNETGDGLPFHQGVTNFGAHFPTHRAWCTSSSARTADAGDLLFSVRAPVGRINFAPDRLVVGRGLAAIRHAAGAQAFLWLQLGERVQEDSMGGGTIFKAVTKDDVHKIPWLEPTARIRQEFDALAETLLRQIQLLTAKQEVLARTRDLLLPRLISGDVVVEPNA